MTITERARVAGRERRVLARVSWSAWRLAQAEAERTWALASAHAEGVSIRTLAVAVGLSPSRVHQLVTGADLDALDTAVGELRAAGWPAPEDPESGADSELDRPKMITDRLTDEVGWLRRCAGWITQLDAGGYPPALTPRLAANRTDTTHDTVGLARVAAILERIAADLDELTRALRVELNAAAPPVQRTGQRRRIGEPDLGFREFCARQKLSAIMSWVPCGTEKPLADRLDQGWQQAGMGAAHDGVACPAERLPRPVPIS